MSACELGCVPRGSIGECPAGCPCDCHRPNRQFYSSQAIRTPPPENQKVGPANSHRQEVAGITTDSSSTEGIPADVMAAGRHSLDYYVSYLDELIELMCKAPPPDDELIGVAVIAKHVVRLNPADITGYLALALWRLYTAEWERRHAGDSH